jgi:pimeloyl-ACP methyl ester carboxylesterase
MHIVQAAEDRIAPAEALSDLIKQAYPERMEIVTVANAEHAMLPEQTAAVGEAVLEFLQK